MTWDHKRDQKGFDDGTKIENAEKPIVW